MSFLSVVGLMFIILKVIGVITWSWWLVLLPIIIGAVIWVTLSIALFVTLEVHGREEIKEEEEEEW